MKNASLRSREVYEIGKVYADSLQRFERSPYPPFEFLKKPMTTEAINELLDAMAYIACLVYKLREVSGHGA